MIKCIIRVAILAILMFAICSEAQLSVYPLHDCASSSAAVAKSRATHRIESF